jgi:hypothetical protein
MHRELSITDIDYSNKIIKYEFFFTDYPILAPPSLGLSCDVIGEYYVT